MNRPAIERLLLCLGGLIAAIGLCYSAIRQAPVNDEFGHFFAGLCYWQTGDTAIFNVNPPLLRSIATGPGYFLGMRAQPPPPPDTVARPEFQLGRQLFIADPQRFQTYLSLGRMFVVAITLLGAVLLYQWARQLADVTAGIVAAGLWLAQPQILSHGALITGDVFCGVWLLFAARVMVWTMERMTIARSIGLGAALAIAVLAKFTGLVLVPIVALFFAWNADRYRAWKLAGCLLIVVATMLVVLAIPYRFEHWGQSLFEYRFVSSTFIDLQSQLHPVAERMPILSTALWVVPLPEQLVLGIDRQQLDFERGLPSYAAGYHGHHGWWWFYIYSMLVKLPMGTWLAIGFAMAIGVWMRSSRDRLGLPLLILLSMLAITAMQDGFAQQHRYILPAYPLLFLAIGVVAGRALVREGDSTGPRLARLSGRAILVGVVLSVAGSAWVAPHWLSAFNTLAGGNRTGFKCLFNDASDWGQDTYRVRDWIQSHQGSMPIYVNSNFSGSEELRAVGAEFEDFLSDVEGLRRPCWLVVSKSDYVLNPSLEKRLDRLPVSQCIGGTHVVFELSRVD